MFYESKYFLFPARKKSKNKNEKVMLIATLETSSDILQLITFVYREITRALIEGAPVTERAYFEQMALDKTYF